MPRKIILDCDPGHDDAMAILLAHGNPEIELLAITTVAGNQTVDKTSLNARRVCTAAGIHDVPVASGCDRPLTRDLKTAAYIHGESGLDGPPFGAPTVLQRIAALGTPIARIAVELMEFFRETYRRNAGFDSPPVHDPCAVARLIDARVMTCVDAHVAIETRGDFTSGMTVTDFSGRLGQNNVQVATRLDVDRFWNLMVGA